MRRLPLSTPDAKHLCNWRRLSCLAFLSGRVIIEAQAIQPEGISDPMARLHMSQIFLSSALVFHVEQSDTGPKEEVERDGLRC